LDKLIKHKNIVNFAKAQRLGWYGHTGRMQAIYSWEPISKGPTGRPTMWRIMLKIYTEVKRVKLENPCPG